MVRIPVAVEPVREGPLIGCVSFGAIETDVASDIRPGLSPTAVGGAVGFLFSIPCRAVKAGVHQAVDGLCIDPEVVVPDDLAL
jgi:hypothetical protein